MAPKSKLKNRVPERPADIEAKNVVGFVRNNWKMIASIAGVVAVIGAVIAAYAVQKTLVEQRASQMLLGADSADRQEALLNQYPSSSSAPIALLALASGAFHAESYEQAHARYVQFREKYPNHVMGPVAELGEIMCHEAMGRIGVALDGFAGFVEEYQDHFLAPQALFGKARCLQAMGRYADARAIYEDFIEKHPDSGWAAVAESSLSFLIADERRKGRAE